MAGLPREYFRKLKGEVKYERYKAACRIDLKAYLESLDYHIERVSTKDDYVLKKSPLGKIRLKMAEVWLCFVDVQPMNAVQLVERLKGCTKTQAVDHILGKCDVNPSIKDNSYAIGKAEEKQKKHLDELPEPTAAHINAGVDYLKTRGIERSTFEMLRAAGNAQYTRDGLCFIGRKPNGSPGLQETRLINPKPDKNNQDKLKKHSVSNGSKRTYAITILGTNKEVVEIVEGNFDAMALYEMNKRNLAANNQPIIIISGGKDTTRFLENSAIIELLKNASLIKCYGDNEVVDKKDFDSTAEHMDALIKKQAISDLAHLKRIEQIKLINQFATVEYHKPPLPHHDLAELNHKIKNELMKTGLPKPTTVKKFKF